jgi:hypothetical protein
VESHRQTDGRRGLAEWSALGGIAFVALFIVGLYFMFNGTPDSGGPPQKIIDYYGDSGNRDQIMLGWLFAGLGLLFFLFFVASVRHAVSRSDRSGILATLAALGGGIYAAVALCAVALEAAVMTMSDDTYQHQVYPELIHAVGDAGYVMHAAGGAALGVMILAASIAFIRSGGRSRWFGWLGIIVVLAALATISFIGAIVWMGWIVIASLILFWKGAAADPVPEAQ